jgi:hypothetical protein
MFDFIFHSLILSELANTCNFNRKIRSIAVGAAPRNRVRAADGLIFGGLYYRIVTEKNNRIKETKMIKRFFILIIVFIFFTVKGYSYIDPGTGSYVVQIIIAAFVGASLGIKLFWDKIKAFFSKKQDGDHSENDGS